MKKLLEMLLMSNIKMKGQVQYTLSNIPALISESMNTQELISDVTFKSAGTKIKTVCKKKLHFTEETERIEKPNKHS